MGKAEAQEAISGFILNAGFERPNGLALSADQKTMFVSDTGLESGNPNAVGPNQSA